MSQRTQSQSRRDGQAAAISCSLPKGNGSVSFKVALSQILFIKGNQWLSQRLICSHLLTRGRMGLRISLFLSTVKSTVNQRQGGTTAVTSCLKVDLKIEIIELHQDETLS